MEPLVWILLAALLLVGIIDQSPALWGRAPPPPPPPRAIAAPAAARRPRPRRTRAPSARRAAHAEPVE